MQYEIKSPAVAQTGHALAWQETSKLARMACRAIQFMNNPMFTPFSIQVRRCTVFIRQTIFEPSTGVFVHVQLAKTSIQHGPGFPLALLAMKKLIADLAEQNIRRLKDDVRIPPITVTPKRRNLQQADSLTEEDPEGKIAQPGVRKRATKACVTDTTYMSNYELTSFPEWVCMHTSAFKLPVRCSCSIRRMIIVKYSFDNACPMENGSLSNLYHKIYLQSVNCNVLYSSLMYLALYRSEIHLFSPDSNREFSFFWMQANSSYRSREQSCLLLCLGSGRYDELMIQKVIEIDISCLWVY